MTLKQAFTEWAAIPQNTALAARHRTATNSVLMKKYGDDDVRQFTAFYTRKLMQDCELPQPMKTQAASILVHVLKYAAGKNACVMPDFDFSIAGERPNTEIPDPSGSTPKKNVSQQMFGQESSEESITPEPPSKGKRHGGGRPRVPVVQVDPKTGKIVARYEGKIEAALSVGANRSSVATAIVKGHLCKGYYWFPADTKKSRIKMFIAGKLINSVRKKNSTKQDKSCPGNEAVGSQEIERGSAMPQTASEVSITRTPLSSFSEEELKEELCRRGWTGTLYKHLIF